MNSETLTERNRKLVEDFANLFIGKHGRPSPDSSGGAVVDLFRLEDRKIAEH